MKMQISGIDAVIAEISKKEKEAKQKARQIVATKAIAKLREATPVDTGHARDGWRLDGNGNIVNDVEYIEDLNNGHSQQAPSHFVEKTLLSMPEVKANGFIVVHKA